MKRLIVLLTLLLVGSLALAEEPLATWPDTEDFPTRIVHAGDVWYAHMGRYGENDATLAVGSSPDAMEIVYEADALVWGSMVATETHAAWMQQQGRLLSWMLYDRASGETGAVYVEAITDVRPGIGVALGADALYYIRTDTKAGTAELVRHDLATGEETVLHAPGGLISCLTLRDEELMLAQQVEEGWQLLRLDAENGDETGFVQLPQSVDMVYAASYEEEYRAWILYYHDKAGFGGASEYVGFYLQGKFNGMYDFGAGGVYSYAVDDAVTLTGSHAVWTIKREASGRVVDNFVVLDVDMATGNVASYPGGYTFTLDGDALLVLTLDPENNRVVLEKVR